MFCKRFELALVRLEGVVIPPPDQNRDHRVDHQKTNQHRNH